MKITPSREEKYVYASLAIAILGIIIDLGFWIYFLIFKA
jgi:hypothetical protein